MFVASGLFGISNPRTFVVGSLEETVESESNDTFETPDALALNSTVNASLSRATDVDFYQFEGKKDQRIIIDCRADRIDSPMVAVVQVYSPDGRRLLSARDNYRSDPVTDILLPVDGKYILKVYDLTFQGSKQHNYRLSVHTKPHIDFVMPPCGQPGSTSNYTLYGRNLPGGLPAELRIGQTTLQKVDVQITLPAKSENSGLVENGKPYETGLNGTPYIWESKTGHSNPVTIYHTSSKLVREDDTKEVRLDLPGEFVGQFEKPNDIDSFRFSGKAKEKYRIEVFGHRMGFQVDPVIVVEQVVVDKEKKETFKRLATVGSTKNVGSIGGIVFESHTDDPVYDLTAPADGEYRVSVRDLDFQTKGDPRMVYRVRVKKRVPDFHLAALPLFPKYPMVGATPSSLVLRKGGTVSISVMVARKDGFSGSVQLSAKGFPEGVTCNGSMIGPKQTSAILVLEASEKAVPWIGDIEIIGRLPDEEVSQYPHLKDVEQIAQAATVLASVGNNIPASSRVARSTMLSVVDEATPYQIVNHVNAVEVRQSQQILVPINLLKQNGFDDKVAMVWNGLPRNSNITTKNVTIDKGKSDELLQVFVKSNAPTGVYTLSLTGTADVNYRRNPALQTRAEKEVADLTAEIKKKTEEIQSATKAKAEISKQKDKTKEQVNSEIAKVDETIKAANARKKAAEDAKKAADKKLAAAKKSTAPKKIKVYTQSAPLVIRVKPAPVSLSLSVPGGGAIKRGQSIDVKATIKRLNNFKGAVELSLPLPPNVKGISAAAVSIPADKTEGILKIQAAADATEGQLNYMVVQAKADFQGDARVDAPITLKVSK